jgi:hypothetical protein
MLTVQFFNIPESVATVTLAVGLPTSPTYSVHSTGSELGQSNQIKKTSSTSFPRTIYMDVPNSDTSLGGRVSSTNIRKLRIALSDGKRNYG